MESMTRSMNLLVDTEGAGLLEHGIHKGSLPMIDMGDDGDVAQVVFSHKGGTIGRNHRGSQALRKNTPIPFFDLDMLRFDPL
jgi:hypothetical protein